MVRPIEFERPLEWSDAFSVGHDLLDCELRGLLASINNFRTIGTTQNPELRCVLFHSLVLFARLHFEHQDTVLRDTLAGEFPPRANQALIDMRTGAHEIALARLSAIGNAMAKAPANEMPRHYQALKLWFIEHAVSHNPHLNDV
jgi:hemerythrin